MDFPCTSCNQLRSNNSETREEFRKHLNIGSNNEGENPLISHEEMMHDQIDNFESSEEIDNPKTNKNAKSPEELNSSERSIEFEKHSNAESHNEDENPPIIREEMGNEERESSESSKKIGIPETATRSQETCCNYCSKAFKSKTLLRRHINRMHKNSASKNQPKNTVETLLNELKAEHDTNFSWIKDTLNRHTGYIRKNAENITELLNTLKHNKDQIKEITEFLFQNDSSKSNRKMFGCLLCNKNFSTKASLYSHKYHYHKRSDNEKDFKCEKCGDSLENETDLRIHNYRWHRASL